MCIWSNSGTAAVTTTESTVPSDTVDLQVDYWMSPTRSDSQERGDRSLRKEVKCSLKTMFRSMRVFRMPTATTTVALPSATAMATADTMATPALSMIVVTREKKQKSAFCHFRRFVLFLFIFSLDTKNAFLSWWDVHVSRKMYKNDALD